MDANSIVSIGTPIIVPLVIALFKKISPNIPTWALPAIAPVLGTLVGVIANYALTVNGNLWLAAALGLAGVGVREILDQVKTEVKPEVKPTP